MAHRALVLLLLCCSGQLLGLRVSVAGTGSAAVAVRDSSGSIGSRSAPQAPAGCLGPPIALCSGFGSSGGSSCGSAGELELELADDVAAAVVVVAAVVAAPLVRWPHAGPPVFCPWACFGARDAAPPRPLGSFPQHMGSSLPFLPFFMLPPCKGGGGVCQHGGEHCLLCVLKCALPRGHGGVCQATTGWGHPICVEGFFVCGPLLTGIPAAWQPFRSALGVGANDPCLLLSSVSCKRTVSTTRYGVPLQRSCLFSPCNTLFSSRLPKGKSHCVETF